MRKLNNQYSRNVNSLPSRSKLRGDSISALDRVIKTEREKIFQQHRKLVTGHEHLLALALNEAEAIVWQTDFPHLIFPALAQEKAEGIVNWHHRQKSIQRSFESAFAA
ncbi:MAG: hypothetical protein ABIP71_09055 [Verrucomicrobiota bacterium]